MSSQIERKLEEKNGSNVSYAIKLLQYPRTHSYHYFFYCDFDIYAYYCYVIKYYNRQILVSEIVNYLFIQSLTIKKKYIYFLKVYI